MIIDGRMMAEEMLARTKMRAREDLVRAPRVVAIVASNTPATRSYLAIKNKRAIDAGCILDIVQLSEGSSTKDLVAAVLSAESDAVIVQLPLPSGVHTKEVCDAIPLAKDADVLSQMARERFERDEAYALLPPVVGAMCEIFKQHAVVVRGKKAVVIGEGWLVGKPCVTWLTQQGAEVTLVTKGHSEIDLSAALGAADIIVSGAGSPHLITPDLLKQGVILIDAGTSESGGVIVGDADPACADKCSLFTPAPGGIGPLAVACLFENAVTLAEKATHI